MARIKEVSQNAAQQALGNGLPSTQSITPTEDVAMFDAVMSNANTGTATDKQSGEEQNTENNDETNNVDGATATGETQVHDNEGVAGASESGVVDAAATQQEVDEINQYQMSLAALAAQLGVVLNPGQQSSQGPQKEVQAEAVLKVGQQVVPLLEQKAEAISPDLIRKVDVATLKRQLDAIMGDPATMELKPPVTGQTGLGQRLLATMPVEGGEQANPVVPQEQRDVVQFNFLKVDDFDLKGFGHKRTQDKLPGAPVDLAEQIKVDAKQNLTRVLPLVSNKQPAVVLNVVSVDLTKDQPETPQGTEQPLFNLFGAGGMTTLTPKENQGLLIQPTGQTTSSQNVQTNLVKLSQSAVTQVAPPVSLSTVQPANLNQISMDPLRAKVEAVVLAMAQSGKSGTTRIQIHPPHLGAIDIKLEVKDKTVAAQIITQHESTRELIEKQLPQLKAMLAADNMSFDSFSLNHDEGHFKQAQNLLTEFGKGEQQDLRGDQQKGAPETRQEQLEKLRLAVSRASSGAEMMVNVLV